MLKCDAKERLFDLIESWRRTERQKTAVRERPTDAEIGEALEDLAEWYAGAGAPVMLADTPPTATEPRRWPLGEPLAVAGGYDS